MPSNRRVVALAFALALAIGGLVASSGQGTDSPDSGDTEVAGGTWS